MLPLAGGLYLGWALGANDGANVFGTAVASRIITFRKASILCAVAIIIGAICQGEGGIHTLSGLSTQTHMTLLVVSVSAAITVTLMTIMRLPISASQATVGSIAGVGLATGSMQWGGFIKVVICWVASPIGALIIACIIYKLLAAFIRHTPMSVLTRDKILWSGLIIVGIYGSYALGANSSANATGIFSGQFPGISDRQLALFGGIAIASGVLTYSKRVMMAVGKGIMPMDAFTALVTVSSMATTVHIFAFIGVPVSTSQATIGAIMGIGLIRGVHSIKFKTLRNIGFGWLLTPLIALILSSSGYAIFCLAKPGL
jgi:inorganic phosphate transporter, PiT family